MATVQFVLMSKGCKVDQETGTGSILDIFYDITAHKMPLNIGFVVTIFWGGNPGELFSPSMAIVDPNGGITLDLPLSPIILDPNGAHTAMVPLQGLVFPSIGTYLIKINVEGVNVKTHPLVVNPDKNLKS